MFQKNQLNNLIHNKLKRNVGVQNSIDLGDLDYARKKENHDFNQ